MLKALVDSQGTRVHPAKAATSTLEGFHEVIRFCLVIGISVHREDTSYGLANPRVPFAFGQHGQRKIRDKLTHCWE